MTRRALVTFTGPRVIAALALCGLAGVAAAQAPGPRAIAPPPGWSPPPVPPDPTRPGVTSMEVYYPPPSAGAPAGPQAAALYVTRAEHPAAPGQRDAIASGELDELLAAQRRQGAGAVTRASARRADEAARQLEASLTWVDESVDVIDTSRVVVAADPQRVVAITGQCLLRTDAPAALAKACEAALATLDPGIPAAARVPLAITEPAAPAPATASPAPATAGPAPTADPVDAPRPAPPPPARLDDASRIELPAQPKQLQRSSDRRPIYFGLGLIAIALVFWWNRRRRERFEADRNGDGDGDGDGDDLHAAAAGDRTEEKEKDA